jgi:chemotaxis protein CheZ
MGNAAEIDDLEALFDQVAAETRAAQAGPVTPAAAPVAVSAAAPAAAPANEPAHDICAVPAAGHAEEDMFHRVGHLTRTLHDALRELGYDRNLESAVSDLPDARDRLNYIATLTGQAADRALSAVEHGQAIQKSQQEASARLSASWEKLYAGALSVEEFKALAAETRAYLSAAPKQASDTHEQFHAIMMAQDFHDLTGQVINRVVTLANDLEVQLVRLLIDARPADAKVGGEEWLSGPAMNAGERTDVVANQAQVDDLLESLGF